MKPSSSAPCQKYSATSWLLSRDPSKGRWARLCRKK